MGRIDGWAPTWFATLLALGMAAGFSHLLLIFPRGSRHTPMGMAMNKVAFFVSALLCWFHVVAMHTALSGSFPAFSAIMGGVFLLFLLMGPQLSQLRPNRWAGYRVPWTMRDPVVWDETHRFAAKAMTTAGVLGMGLIVLGVPAYWAMIPVGAALLAPLAVAQRSWRRRHGRGSY